MPQADSLFLNRSTHDAYLSYCLSVSDWYWFSNVFWQVTPGERKEELKWTVVDGWLQAFNFYLRLNRTHFCCHENLISGVNCPLQAKRFGYPFRYLLSYVEQKPIDLVFSFEQTGSIHLFWVIYKTYHRLSFSFLYLLKNRWEILPLMSTTLKCKWYIHLLFLATVNSDYCCFLGVPVN